MSAALMMEISCDLTAIRFTRNRAKPRHPNQATRPQGFYRRLGRPHHHGPGRAALLRLWQEKRGEIEPPDLSGNLSVQLGHATEALNRTWFERNAGASDCDVQKRVYHPVNTWMVATLTAWSNQTGAVFESKFMLPWSFSEEAAAEKHMAQLQHNMWVTNARSAVLSIITGGGKWVEISIDADSLYQHLLLTAEKKFLRCMRSGEPPRLFSVETPRPRLNAVRIVDMSDLQRLGRFRGHVQADARGLCRARDCPCRTEAIDAAGCQRSDRSWTAGQALKVRGGQL